MKILRDSSSKEISSSDRRGVTFYTYKKWMTLLDRSFQMLPWLDCDTRLIKGKEVVTNLNCKVCTKHKFRIILYGRRHFSKKWIDDTDSIKSSKIRDHANADQHIHAMKII